MIMIALRPGPLILVVCLVISSSSAPSASGSAPAEAVYYVAADGVYGDAGTIESPTTLEGARDKIRALNPRPAAGASVYLRGGVYQRSSAFTLSGAQDSGSSTGPIVYRNYPAEVAVIEGSASPAAISLNGVSYVTIEGLQVADSRWLEAVNAHFVVVRNNIFRRTPASGTTGNVRFISSDHNHIIGNVLDDGNDNLLLIDSDYNRVAGNTLREGRHSVLSIRCSNYNLIRDNVFSNTQQKIAEVYDCGEDTTAVPHAFNATHHNVIEHNVFAEASSYYSTSGGNGLQYAGQDGIIRYNVFYHTNVGLGMQVYSDEALYNQHNRVYHNVFYDNDCAGIAVRGDAVDNTYRNNILYQNKGLGGGDCFGVGPAQVVYRNPLAEFMFDRNNILNEHAGEAVIQQEFGSGNTLAHFEATYPALFSDNLEVDPQFNAEAAFDFTLKSTSPMVDAGTFLARAVGSGSGVTLPVDDARYFHAGYGLAGVAGDLVQLAGQTETARVVNVDYDTHTLTLDRALSWQAGQGVSLAYRGTAPDLGAHEFLPRLILSGTPAHQALHLSWTVDVTLPLTSTWAISYYSQTVPITITGLPSPTRAYTLGGLTNYAWYTVTLNALLNTTPLYTDTIKLMPTNRVVYLPIVRR